ncbi:MAG: chromosome segregation protein SMC [Saprospiraceae bacterium]
MRLKSLELKGFKSFAQDTVIHFNEDVIGIVGPNGSGKSNIVDAIRWVLGEQNGKELRLDKMTSVIFNGTKTKKAANFAQVTIIFDNHKSLVASEYSTIAISRLLYRAGHSEYRLNGVACRLKDIYSLLMDTGIGSDTYAIIALGMVDDILNDKENSRRRMLEQAAGISKYKNRKKETLQKLSSTTENLDRVEDLLFEIESNMKLLEKQAKRTQKYYDLKAQYKSIAVSLAGIKLSVLRDKYKQIELQINNDSDRYRNLDAELAILEASLESEKKENLHKEQNLSEHQRELNQLVGNIRGMEADKKMALQKLQFLVEKKEQMQSQFNDGKTKSELLLQEIAGFKSKLDLELKIETDNEKALEAEEIKMQAQKSTVGLAKTELDHVLSQMQELERALFAEDKSIAVNNGQIINLQSEIQRAEIEIAESDQSSQNQKSQAKNLELELKLHQDQLQSLNEAESNRQQNLQELRHTLEKSQSKLANINRSIDQKQNEQQLTASLVENMEGYPESIKFLYKQKDWAKNCPLLSDILYTPEKYRVVLEQYLEPYLNFFVAPNQNIASAAIKQLRDAQKGKAFFFLINELPEPDLVEPPVMGARRAVDLVESDPAFNRLFRYLLGNVFVLPDHINLNEIEEIDERAIVIQHDGHQIKSFGKISGGSLGLFEGKTLGRRKNLEKLEIDIKALVNERVQYESERENLLQQIKHLESEKRASSIQLTQQALQQVEQSLGQINVRIETYLEQKGKNTQKISEAKSQLEGLNQSNLNARAMIEALQVEENLLKSFINTKDQEYQDLAATLSQVNGEFNLAKIEFIKQQNVVSSIRRELNYRESQVAELKQRIDQISLESMQADRDSQILLESSDKLTIDIQDAYVLRKQQETNLNSVEQSYYGARNSIIEKEEKIRHLNKNRQESQSLINQLKDKFNDIKFELSAMGERLRIEFNIEINELINQESPKDLEEVALKTEVDKLKYRLDNYGEINPLAVEAYTEMEERFNTINTQRNDILEAKKSLEKTIQEIEDKATEQFLAAFEQVKTNFMLVFRSLFTEDDQCDLILENPDAPLESGIQIIAKPKGKRPQSLHQLSGGEKTLTATALLFALYLLKPAPFCIFDEVDAPLDDANIEKFNRIIKKFSGESQFIIVTHNKQTMAAVDVIYGVYMEELGVSGVSQVDFRTFEHTELLESVN